VCGPGGAHTQNETKTTQSPPVSWSRNQKSDILIPHSSHGQQRKTAFWKVDSGYKKEKKRFCIVQGWGDDAKNDVKYSAMVGAHSHFNFSVNEVELGRDIGVPRCRLDDSTDQPLSKQKTVVGRQSAHRTGTGCRQSPAPEPS